MAEIGIDVSGQRSKAVGEYLGHLYAHTLIIVCDHAAKHCPSIWPGMRARLVWPIPDPAAAQGTEEERLQQFREARDRLTVLLKEWLVSEKKRSEAERKK
jgi:arsenate reductase